MESLSDSDFRNYQNTLPKPHTMITRPNHPVRPCETETRWYLGLSVREHFALELMKADAMSGGLDGESADRAVEQADKLIAALNKTP